jgi:hypothetical protein
VSRLQLIRVLVNWDNVMHVPLEERSWDGTTCRSSRSFRFFIETGDGRGDVKIDDGQIALRNIYKTNTGYIITLAQKK